MNGFSSSFPRGFDAASLGADLVLQCRDTFYSKAALGYSFEFSNEARSSPYIPIYGKKKPFMRKIKGEKVRTFDKLFRNPVTSRIRCPLQDPWPWLPSSRVQYPYSIFTSSCPLEQRSPCLILRRFPDSALLRQPPPGRVGPPMERTEADVVRTLCGRTDDLSSAQRLARPTRVSGAAGCALEVEAPFDEQRGLPLVLGRGGRHPRRQEAC